MPSADSPRKCCYTSLITLALRYRDDTRTHKRRPACAFVSMCMQARRSKFARIRTLTHGMYKHYGRCVHVVACLAKPILSHVGMR